MDLLSEPPWHENNRYKILKFIVLEMVFWSASILIGVPSWLENHLGRVLSLLLAAFGRYFFEFITSSGLDCGLASY